MRLTIKMTIGLLLGFFLIQSSFAEDSINLTGGTLAPASKFTLSFDQLENRVSYNVNCKIVNNSNEEIIMGFNSEHEYPWKTLNSNSIHNQGVINPGENILAIEYVFKGRNIFLINADQDLPLIIENCTATAREDGAI
ncbi:MAG: hypothetical protein H0U57_02685 [Tatlockia sp.]|nr:hypothetical protein [Tatlockia sp.]